MNELIEKAKSSKTFCIYPFSHLSTKTDGSIKLCCRSEAIGNIRNESLSEIWNGKNISRIRAQLLNGERPSECDTCWGMEDVGARSMRMRALTNGGDQSRWNLFSDLISFCSSDGKMISLPRSLELKISNLCNLKCRMCSPIDSTLWAKEWPDVSDLMKVHDAGTYRASESLDIATSPLLAEYENKAHWWEDIDKLINQLEIVEFAGGEPLIDPVHFELLDRLSSHAHKIHLKYSTNLTRLSFRGRNVTDLWEKFASVEVYASVDGLHEVYDYIRTGGNFKDVDENLTIIAESKNFVLEELAIACTVQVYNAFQLTDIAEYFLKRKIKFHTHHVTFPRFLNVQVLPQHIKNILTENTNLWMKREHQNSYEEYALPRLKLYLEDYLNFMNGKDESHLIPVLCEFTRRMDKIRNTDATQLSPLLAEVLLKNTTPFSSEAVR